MFSQIIRRAQFPADWRAIRRICGLTGNAGEPIPENRWDFFSEIWVGPYQDLWPSWAWVCENQGQVTGYLTGCPDSRRHFALKQKRDLRLLSTLWRYPWNADTQRFLKRTLRLERGPQESFDRSFLQKLFTDFPGHLHMNFDSAFRGQGGGRQIVDRFLEALGPQSGVHVFCGEAARGFYLKTGFQDLQKIEFKPGVWVYCLGRKT